MSHSPVTVGPSYGEGCNSTEPYTDAPSHLAPSRCQLIISHINGRHEKDHQEVLTLFIISSYISEKIPSWKLTWKPPPVSAPGSTGLFLGPQPPPMWCHVPTHLHSYEQGLVSTPYIWDRSSQVRVTLGLGEEGWCFFICLFVQVFS